MESMMIVAAILVFAPALLMLYYFMKDYTYPAVEEPFFEDSKLFTLFAVGLIEGFLISMFYSRMVPYWTNVLVSLAFGVIQALAILVVLNLKRFHGKSDTVFYGFSMGIGQGVGVAFGVIIALMSLSTMLEEIDPSTWAVIVSFVAMELMLMSSAGTVIGEGVARLRLGEFTIQASLVIVLCMIFWAFTIMTADSMLWILPTVLMVVASAYYFYHVVYSRLSSVVADVLKLEGKKRNDMPR